jgi:Family of unknown function (DUF6644)
MIAVPSVLALFRWCQNTSLGAAVRGSAWMFPAVEAGHLIALAVFGAAVLIVDLRLWDLGLRQRTVADVARNAQPLLLGSLALMVITGYMLFAADAERYYYNAAFWSKMVLLFFAVVFTFTVRQTVVMADETSVGPFWGRLVALISLALWSGVGIGGKAIGFY